MANSGAFFDFIALWTRNRNNICNFLFDNRFILIYNDPRRFGFVEVIEGDYNNYQRFKHIGIEPLSKKFDGKYLSNKIKKSSRTLKNILMDQKMVAGLGNIYVSEALWDSQIIPSRIGENMSIVDCKKLVRSIKKVLCKAVIHLPRNKKY